MLFPKLNHTPRSRFVIPKFLGYDRSPHPLEGSLCDMENLTSDGYPTLSPRSPRGYVARLERPQGLLGKDALAYVDGGKLYWNGSPVPGLSLSPEGEKSLVSMGAYIVIFPDGMYLNTADLTDYGSLDNVRSITCTADLGVTYSLCQADGTLYDSYTISGKPPENPTTGAYWLDTTNHALKVYSADSGLWTEVPTVYVRLECTGLGKGFSQYDGVTISGCSIKSLNGSAILQDVSENALVITGLIDQGLTQSTGTVTISRKAPKLDYVTQCGNRLWGCKYGMVDGKTVNEIYACSLGDFKNWNQFRGLSTDSYAAARGSDGPWTGAVTHLGCPLFFKENVIEKVYPSSSGAHEIVTTNCRGVQKGSHKSLCIVGEMLYYKSPSDICAYDGSLPVSVSRALGDLPGKNAVSGALGSKLYISTEAPSYSHQLLVYDTACNLWHREDNLHVLDFCRVGTELFALDVTGNLLAMTGKSGTPEGAVEWSAQTGVMGLGRADQKHISRLTLRTELEKGSSMEVYVQYDSSGQWVHGAKITGTGFGSQVIPMAPHRCDHFSLLFRGRGPCRLHSICAITEEGSDTQWP